MATIAHARKPRVAKSASQSGADPTAHRKPSPWYVVRRSKIHGKGVFARRDIPKGTRIVEYLGDRISHKEADERYAGHDPNDNHTFLFIVDRKTVIDGGVKGNDARFINHSCDGNCESEIEDRRVYIEAIKDIKKGEELGYDYQIGRSKEDPPNVDEIYACRCGSPKCRGTMLWPAKRPAPRKRKKAVRRGVAKRADARGGGAKRGKSARTSGTSAAAKRAGATRAAKKSGSNRGKAKRAKARRDAAGRGR